MFLNQYLLGQNLEAAAAAVRGMAAKRRARAEEGPSPARLSYLPVWIRLSKMCIISARLEWWMHRVMGPDLQMMQMCSGIKLKCVVFGQMWPIKLHNNRTLQMLIRAGMLVKAN